MKSEIVVKGITPDTRRASLRAKLADKECLRFMEAHSPLSALIAENATIRTDYGILEYDGFWSSSLTDSTQKGKPDIEILDVAHRLINVSEIFESTSKPLIFDGDTGGRLEHFVLNVRSLERVGVSAVIIEDKTGLKKNSLLGNDVVQTQASISEFSEKIAAGKATQLTSDFMIIARIESLILDAGMADALERASAYVGAVADAVMIHSRQTDPDEIFEFAKHFRRLFPSIPLVCVPTSYIHVHFDALREAGFNIVIYANQLLRAAFPAMRSVAESILKFGRPLETEPYCLPIKEVLELVPGTK